MSSIEKYISPILKSQFPDFYRDQGEVFIAFVEEYYKWLETNNSSYSNYPDALIDGNPLYHSRRLLEYKDLDKTVDEFFVYFKEKYLKGVDFETNISKRRFIKASHDLFGAKGSKRSFELFFNLLYGTPIEIYIPGEDILKPSDGTWTVPVYLELSRTNRTLSFPGKMITGSLSGATAFVESIITRNINGKLIDVAYLSDVSGNFETGEIVSDGAAVADAPKVIGSLSGINITSGGEGFSVGEIVTVTSDRGVEARARIDGIDSVTGIVRFTIIYSGWGYSNTAETTVSTKTIPVSNVYNSNSSLTFFRNETVSQNLFSFSLTDVSGVLSSGRAYRNGDNSTPSLSYAVSRTQNTASVATGNTATLILNQASANVFTNTIIYEANRTKVYTSNAVIFTIGQSVVQENGGSNNVTGIVADTGNVSILTVNTSTVSSNGIHIGAYVYQSTSNAEGYVIAIPRENNFTFTNVNMVAISNTVGTFNNTSIVTMYADSSKANNFGSFTPTEAILGYSYLLVETNFSTNTRWSSSNTILKSGTPSVNTTIKIASDIGGKVSSYSNVTATANLFAQNTTAIGLTSVNGTFYGNGNTKIYGLSSNTYANTIAIYAGQNADFSVGYISDSETVRLATDFINANNDGPGSNSVKYSNMLITGVNSGYGYLSTVLVYDSGTGYDNTNIVTFTGGNSGAGSFGVGNASLVTDASGNIVSITLSSNTGNGIITTPSVSVVNSTGGSSGVGSGATLIPASKYGFPKYLDGSINTPLIDLFAFDTKTIGSISTLSSINPGEDYNANPFTVAYEPLVAAHGKRDMLLEIEISSGGGFVEGEYVNQTTSQSGVVVTSNSFSGNTNLEYEVNEIVYSTDGIANTATGVVFSHTRNLVSNVHTTVLISNTGTWQNTINVSVLTVSSNSNFEPGNKITQSTTANGVLVTSNSTTLIVRNVQGTFTPGSVSSNASPTPGSTTISSASNSSIYKIIGLTTDGISSITNTSACTASTTARAKVVASSNNILNLKRISLFTDFVNNENITGVTSGTVANVVSVAEDPTSNIVGDNAIISANVVASNGTITIATVVDSGFGYESSEGVTLLSLDGLRAATGSANVSTEGVGAGYYTSTRGFLDDAKYIHDGEYYQNYSYEIQTSLPLDKYSDVLKEVLHVSGKKLFGRVVTSPVANLDISASMTITQA